MTGLRRRVSRSIRARITVGALIVVAVVLGVASVAAVQILDRSLTESVAVSIEQDLETIGEQLESGIAAVDTIDGDVLVRLSASSTAVNDDEAEALPVVVEDGTERVTIDGEPYLVATETTDVGVLTVGHSLEHVVDAVSTATMLLAVAVPLFLALIGGVVWVVTGRALAPVERLRRQVDAIDAADLQQRVDPGDDDELGALAGTMNRMLGRIQHAQTTQRQFVSDASHELRSPLATIRQYAEVAAAHPESVPVDALSTVVLEEGERMQELVESLLLLARLDEHREHAAVPVDLDDIALAEARRLRSIGVAADARGIGAGRVIGDRALLARAVRNLVDNAARHARHLVTIRVVARNDRVLLQVEDDGTGILPEERERVFARFARLDEGRARDEGGSGLGLAIVAEIARAHRGTIAVTEGSAGGALFTLDLPAS